MLKENKGVTLVALVITIIVLLILAGVTLSMVMGDSGIFSKANEASSKTAISSAKDAVRLATLEAVTDQYDNNSGTIISEKEITSDNVVSKVNEKLNNAGNDYKIATGTAGSDLVINKVNSDSTETATGVTVNFTVKSNSVTPTFNK